ncbi:molybdate ABC transporter substrate-binding protein [Parahaliea maris]|uniref:molybdate ABC transporter substrate-binding protein n=1 Tax=Parahaliea maris TaxID=2716870 RepID=UPI0016500A76|nr:molybdate ABC transporter substrate-binding protein [Parahaliea maris]
MRSTWLLCLFITLAPLNGWAAESLRIAVAANFRVVLEQLAPAYQKATGNNLTLSSASTGVLYNQIRHGAPFDVLLAADSATPAALAEQGLGSSHRCYALGELVLVGGELDALADPGKSLAIANPATAPYGRAAEEVLQRPAFAAGHGRHLVRGNNAVQTWQFWHSGSVELALVPRSLAQEAGIPIPRGWYSPLQQDALILQRAANNPAAEGFLDWLQSPAIQAELGQAGYGRCP